MKNDLQLSLCQYPTPLWLAEAIVDRHFEQLDCEDLVVEPSCGPGSFLSAIPDHVPAIGIEIDAQLAEIARENTGREVITGDFDTVALNVQPTHIIGNPPFELSIIDKFLFKAHTILPEGGRVGFILPTYAFQTAKRVAGYGDRWSLFQEMIPRNVYPGLSKPLMFAIFSKDQKRTMVGLAFYREATDLQNMQKQYRDIIANSTKSVWASAIGEALLKLGGYGSLQDIYREIEGNRPTRTEYWRQQVRKVVRQHSSLFEPVMEGRYRLINVQEPCQQRLIA